MARQHMRGLALAAMAGAAGALLLDPQSGRRRRALLADKLGHFRRAVPRKARRVARAVPGPARGAMHGLRRRLPGYQPPAPPDGDTFIKQRVESSLGRERHLWPASASFEAVDGVVRIRGTVADERAAQQLVERVSHVEGVRAVESRMTLPGGVPVMVVAGNRQLVDGPPRAVVLGTRVRERLLERWPGLTDQIILDSDGHLDRLTDLIQQRSGESATAVRAALDEILLSAV